jgi:hypothetical protein
MDTAADKTTLPPSRPYCSDALTEHRHQGIVRRLESSVEGVPDLAPHLPPLLPLCPATHTLLCLLQSPLLIAARDPAAALDYITALPLLDQFKVLHDYAWLHSKAFAPFGGPANRARLKHTRRLYRAFFGHYAEAKSIIRFTLGLLRCPRLARLCGPLPEYRLRETAAALVEIVHAAFADTPAGDDDGPETGVTLESSLQVWARSAFGWEESRTSRTPLRRLWSIRRAWHVANHGARGFLDAGEARIIAKSLHPET